MPYFIPIVYQEYTWKSLDKHLGNAMNLLKKLFLPGKFSHILESGTIYI